MNPFSRYYSFLFLLLTILQVEVLPARAQTAAAFNAADITRTEDAVLFPLISPSYSFKAVGRSFAVRAARRLGILSVEKTFQLDTKRPPSLHEKVREISVDMLKSHPNAKSVDLITHIEREHGLAVSKATLSRVRRQLGASPDLYPPRSGSDRNREKNQNTKRSLPGHKRK